MATLTTSRQTPGMADVPAASVGRALAVLLAAAVSAAPASAQQYAGSGHPQDAYYEDLSARVWLDRGEEPLLDRGERVRIYYRTSRDAFVAIFNIDTNGTARLVFPRSPDENHWVRGGRDYRLLFPRSQYWLVDDDPGMGYYFIVASPEPFDFSSLDYSYYDRGWDLARVGRTVYSDPYVAMDDYVATLIPDWEYAPYALDFVSYHVGQERYDYPRFLCYDCHGFRSYQAWNPYHYYCSSFRVVIYNDPYYYPSYRYRGSSVVYVRPPRPRQPRFVFKERADGEAGAPRVTSRPGTPVTDRPGVGGDPAPRRGAAGAGSGGAGPARPGGTGSQGGVQGRPGVPTRSGPGSAVRPPGRGTGAAGEARRPTSRLERTDGARRGVPVIPRGDARGATPPRTRPVLERRPPGGSAGSGGATPTRPTPVRPRSGGSGGSSAGGAPPRAGRGGSSSGGGPAVRVIPRRGGGSEGGSGRPSGSVRSGGGSGGSGGSARPPVRVRPRTGGSGGGSGPAGRVRPGTSRSGGGSSPVRVRPRSGSGSGSATPPARVRSRSGGSGSGASTPPVRVRPRSGGAGGGSSPPARVRPKRGGSGGGSARSRPPTRSSSTGARAGRRVGGGAAGGSAPLR